MNEEMQTDEVPSVHSADLFKAMAALVLFLIALVGGVLPLRIESVGSRVVSCLNTAAGGVFFASAMVRHNKNNNTAESDKPSSWKMAVVLYSSPMRVG